MPIQYSFAFVLLLRLLVPRNPLLTNVDLLLVFIVAVESHLLVFICCRCAPWSSHYSFAFAQWHTSTMVVVVLTFAPPTTPLIACCLSCNLSYPWLGHRAIFVCPQPLAHMCRSMWSWSLSPSPLRCSLLRFVLVWC